MKKIHVRKLSAALAGCGLLSVAPVGAAPLGLAQAPAGTVTVAPPPPNLILTIDDSGSMGTLQGATTRMGALKSALKTAFSAANVPDNSIRLGWNTLNECPAFLTSSTLAACGAGGNIVRPLTNAHRKNFTDWVTSGLNASGNTPTHNAYRPALAEFDKPASDKNSPWAEVPGEKSGEYLTCRKSYVMLLTDGEYNVAQSAANTIAVGGSYDLDSLSRVLGDGTPYPPASANAANIYKQGQAASGSYKNTLADLAFHYWAKDADGDSSNNNVKELIRVTTNENGIDKFWNPKNDPATWQHVSTYTIGYGTAASGWTENPNLDGSKTPPETLYDSESLKKLMLGTEFWPVHNWSGQKLYMEMMHAAINGRGKFYPATSEAELVAAIKDLLTDVIPVPEQHVTSAAGSTLSAAVDSSAFYASYDSEKWSGDVTAVTLKTGGGVDAAVFPWGANTAASLLDVNASRKILTTQITLGAPSPAPATSPTWSGKTFVWGNLSASQQTLLGGAALGPGRLDYLRGKRVGEGSTYRKRASTLGDIVNSNVWFMKGVPNAGYKGSDYLNFVKAQKTAARTSAIFVGANDGMLHAFDADDGKELFAYVPLGSYDNLASLTSEPYSHKYFVDGSPFAADYCKTYDASTPPKCSNWGTMLTGFMGAGGKGYFMIDVTDPASVTAGSVRMDTTTGYLPGSSDPDPDIGHIMQKPVTEQENPMATRQIARMNNGKWALVIGNGYNSTNERAVLIVQYLDGSAPTKIVADAAVPAGNGNGLSAPRLMDLNGDSIPDVAYAGDLKGNLWKFDLADKNASNWKVAGGAAMFKAESSSGAVQPITTAPVYQAHPDNGWMIVFGTGQNFTVTDRSDTTVQSFYGLYDFGYKLDADPAKAYIAGGVKIMAPADNTKNSWSLPGRRTTAMKQQTASAGNSRTSANLPAAQVSQMGSVYRGWYLDLPEARERVLRNPMWYDGDLLDLLSDVPAVAATSNDPCQAVNTSAARYFITTLNAVSGNAPNTSVWGKGDLQNRKESDLPILPTRDPGNGTQPTTCVGPDCKDPKPRERNLLGRYFKTPSWRQLQ